MDLLAAWDRADRIPFGRWFFSRWLSRFVPYTGTIRPRVLELGAGRAVVSMRDRRRVRNHLRSVHAIALANLGEVATGLAVLGALPRDRRAILVGLDVRYVKKARGEIRATADWDARALPDHDVEVTVHGALTDATGETVASVDARWRVGLASGSPSPR